MAYKEVLFHSFRKRYVEQKDVWTKEQAMEECTAFFLSQLEISADSVTLDIGTGRGRDVHFFLENGGKATGIDLLPLPEWKEIQEQFPGRAEFHANDFNDWEAEAESYSYIIDNGCFHHQAPQNYSSYLAKVRRLLKKDGRYCLSVFTPDDEMIQRGKVSVMEDGRLGKYFSKEELALLLETEGLKLAASRRIFRPLFQCYYLALVAEKIC